MRTGTMRTDTVIEEEQTGRRPEGQEWICVDNIYVDYSCEKIYLTDILYRRHKSVLLPLLLRPSFRPRDPNGLGNSGKCRLLCKFCSVSVTHKTNPHFFLAILQQSSVSRLSFFICSCQQCSPGKCPQPPPSPCPPPSPVSSWGREAPRREEQRYFVGGSFFLLVRDVS